MKKIIIGTLVGGIIFFAAQTALWMSGFHMDFTSYTPHQDSIMTSLNNYLIEDGMYMIPAANPNSADLNKEHHEVMEKSMGKPWAMIFYHKSMSEMTTAYMMLGLLYSLFACLIASMVLYYGSFNSFSIRFLVAMAFSIFTLSQGVVDNMTWWEFPWHYVKAEVIDLTLGWGVCSVWLAWFVKKP